MSLKKLGIFGLLKDMAGTVMEVLGKMWVRGGELLTSIGEWIGSIVNLFNALFNGEEGEAWEALRVFKDKTVNLLERLWDFLVVWFFDLVAGFWDNIKVWFKKQFIETRGWGMGLFNALLTFLAFHYTRIWAASVQIFGMSVGAAGSVAMGLGAGAVVHGAFASGGITGNGWSLVGEKGPELVRLPAGSRVFSNADSRSMGNNITVNVQGRVGASDAEVRDIANKIGRLVNSQINRNVTTGIRGA